MILVDNINYLREKFPELRYTLKKTEENKDKSFFIEETKKGEKTLYYKNNDKKIYFHSKYNPIREAEAIIEEYKDVKDSNVIFYGTGLGYHIDLFVQNNPDNNFYIFEPILELLEKFLTIRNLKGSEYRNLRRINAGLNNMDAEIDEFLDLNRSNTIIIELPIHKQTFEGEFVRFNEIFLKVVKAKRSEIVVNYGFQRRWIINSMKNFKEVLNTPNILLEKKAQFKDKPAILVAAGPSLNEEIENIRYIKENGLAYIFSVGSAINTLIHYGIYPDAATTYDPKESNKIVFVKILEEGIKDIPVIFGSSVSYEALENYRGEKYHMLTSQDKISNYFLDSDSQEKIDIVLDASSIAVITLQLLSNLGFNPIILAGQNLAYLGKARHSKGIDYSTELTKEEIEKALKIEDVNGNEVLTNEGFNSMRQQIELYISGMKKDRVINTTKNGAKINGTEFVELKTLIENKLKDSIVEYGWLKGHDKKYSKENLKLKLENMENALQESYRFIRDYNSSLNKLFSLVKNRNFKQLDNMYRKLNISIEALESNVFFTTFILQMNRVQHKLLADAVKISILEKDIYKKNIDLLNAYKLFIDACSDDMEFIKPMYEEMVKNIEIYIKMEV